jgi:hypothetical protein
MFLEQIQPPNNAADEEGGGQTPQKKSGVSILPPRLLPRKTELPHQSNDRRPADGMFVFHKWR